MLLGIHASLAAPPSSPSVFRDVTLVAKVFRHYDVIAISESEMIDQYWRWFRQYGLFDFVDDLLPPNQLIAVVFNVELLPGKLTAHNLGQIVTLL